MKRGVPIFIRRGGLTFAAVMIACGLFAPACCQASDVVLLLEQTPVKGGEITPVAGVYHFTPGAEVMLSALPKPGYQFVHWLGDVSDPAATSTVVHLNKPKVIVAVFEQVEHGISADGTGLPTAGGGAPSGLFPTAVDLGKPGGFSGGGGPKPKSQPIVYAIGKKPAPEVPEPATGALLILGGLFALRRKRMN
ncbi:MAG: PEP-CTERM sorting domain-containing protein [Phycisphaerales bacterium]|nr:MAG: PEP-CTERM sorting domain-containing protein [Phycisphaerales bacterium]